MTTARYQHDCEDCVFLGTYGDADLYFCKVRSLMPEGTLLARHSSEPSDYWSMCPSAITENEDLFVCNQPALIEAARLAKARGLT
jgi:hypothetical protein